MQLFWIEKVLRIDYLCGLQMDSQMGDDSQMGTGTI